MENTKVNVTLETEWDRYHEDKFMRRFLSIMPVDITYFRMPQYSVCDYVVTNNTEVRYFMELKIRKETAEQVMSYGGLMLKHKKIVELANLADSTKSDVWVVWAFNNGEGDVYAARPKNLLHLPLEDPPRRRNYRGLATDEEPVCYLDWNKDLSRWRM